MSTPPPQPPIIKLLIKKGVVTQQQVEKGVRVQHKLASFKPLLKVLKNLGGQVRLRHMNIAPFLVSSTVVNVLAQRLLRRICPDGTTNIQLSPIQLQRLKCKASDLQGGKFKTGRGCSKCNPSGYKGRIGVFELLILDEMVRSAILEQRTSHEIRSISIQHSGMVTLLEDGLVKAASGMTTLDEVLRCLPLLQPPRPLVEIRRLSGN